VQRPDGLAAAEVAVERRAVQHHLGDRPMRGHRFISRQRVPALGQQRVHLPEGEDHQNEPSSQTQEGNAVGAGDGQAARVAGVTGRAIGRRVPRGRVLGPA
jgi:hypothetical protein